MRIIAYIVLLVFILSACKKEYVQPKEITENVSFSNDIVPIFSDHCVSCHVSGGLFTGLILSSDVAYNQLFTAGTNAPYINLSNPTSSSLYVKMITNMPPTGLLSSDKTEMILKWIEQGAENN